MSYDELNRAVAHPLLIIDPGRFGSDRVKAGEKAAADLGIQKPYNVMLATEQQLHGPPMDLSTADLTKFQKTGAVCVSPKLVRLH